MSSRRGFTLIEILIVLAILGMVVGIGVPQVNRIFRTNLRNASVRVAGLIRTAYDISIVKASIHRIVLDFDNNAYWLEVSRTGQLIGLDDEGDGLSMFSRRRDQDDEDDIPDYYAYPGRQGEKTPLPTGVIFDSVEDISLDKKFTEGLAYIYFFPHGMTQNMIIRLKSDRGETGFYSIWINPINAKTRIEGRYLEGK